MSQPDRFQLVPESWRYGGKPRENGWYAILQCWDIEEGVFPSAKRWDGSDLEWSVMAIAGPFSDEKSAEAWAYAHDIEV